MNHFVHPLLRARDYQDRPEFDMLRDWWRSRQPGVCALVGIGGAGKTAVAERFLRVLPQGLPPGEGIVKEESLPEPGDVFVFSFYDAPNPDGFFSELAVWLGRFTDEEVEKRTVSYPQLLIWLERAGRSLLVLDGLEKVQDDGARGGLFGQLLDGRLRDFMRRLAFGYLPRLRAIATTRFPLADLEVEKPPLFRSIAIEELPEEAGIALLRRRGVTGSDVELADLVRECGHHALTIDLAGGYVGELGGERRLRLGTSEELERARREEPDPRRRRVLEQEYRFARIAERYRKAFAERDPAALALLERVCLFRLGIDAEALASIFTGQEKAGISGEELARLSETELQQKLDLLVQMRLLEASEGRATGSPSPPRAGASASVRYVIHPAVRDGFLSGLDAEVAQKGHSAAREALEASLGERPGRYPSDPCTLDLLEEIVHHTHAAGHPQEAWNIYWYRIGGYRNLGWRLGAYERGERICRAFAGGCPPQSAPLPKGLSEKSKSAFINEWALYLKNLGRLPAAARCFERGNEMHMRQVDWKNASTGNWNLADVLLLSGRLAEGLQAAEEALRLAELADDAQQRQDSHGFRGHVRGLRGETDAALADFRDALRFQHEVDRDDKRPLYQMRGVRHALLLMRRGDDEEATRLTENHKQIVHSLFGAGNRNGPPCNLLLSDLALRRDDPASARELLQEAHDWAIARDARELLCEAARVRASIALAEATRATANERYEEATHALHEAAASLDEGLNLARDCGYGILHIDLLLVRARLALVQGRVGDALRDALVALEEGVQPPPESGRPELLAATEQACGYVWGEAEARQLLAEATLLQVAQARGQSDFAPAREPELPDKAKQQIATARHQLEQCRTLRERIQDAKRSETERVLEDLGGGVLTRYRLTPDSQPPEVKPGPPREKPSAVFISYAHKDNESFDPERRWLDRLRQHLTPLVRQEDLRIFSDRDLKIGEEWHARIQTELATAKAAVLLVSSAFLESKYIANSELPVLLRNAKEKGVEILPILVSPCLFRETRFKYPDPVKGPEEFTLASLQAATTPEKTLVDLGHADQERALVAVARRLLAIVQAEK